MATHYIKRNDRPTCTDTLTRSGTAINLTGSTVSLCIQNVDTGETFKRSASVVSAVSGTVSYQMAAADTATAGTYRLEWEILNGSSQPETVPSNGYIDLVVLPDIA